MSEVQLQRFLGDVGQLLKEQAISAKRDRDGASDADQLAFENGRLFGYLEVISLLKQELAAFEIPSEAMALDDIEPERDLL